MTGLSFASVLSSASAVASKHIAGKHIASKHDATQAQQRITDFMLLPFSPVSAELQTGCSFLQSESADRAQFACATASLQPRRPSLVLGEKSKRGKVETGHFALLKTHNVPLLRSP